MFHTNPVYQLEIKTSARTVKLCALVLIFNGLLALISFLILNDMIEQSQYSGTMEYEGLVNMYSIMSYIEFGMFMLVIPSSTSGSISGEKERKTLDILLTGKMSTYSIVIGKLMASLNMVMLLAISSLPVLSIVFLFGGITIMDLLVMLITLMISGVFVGSIGILFSVVCKKTTTATVLSYSSILALIAGTYVLNYLVYHLTGAGERADGVRRWIYSFLINPAVTYSTVISAQVANQDILEQLYLEFAPGMIHGRVIRNWIPFSLVIQLGMAFGLIGVAGWMLNPLHKRSRV
ncbi:MAG: ABC transporter permease subunit [Lachnospiraceae bacterium]|nr:ABC transporter permease subunit [Lachnospiraceae bacterium]